MIRREYEGGWLLIPQPQHAWLAGQLAAAWGNQRFAPPRPWPEILFACAEHDLGWAAWELAPTVNPAGLPTDFLELPVPERIALWERGAALTAGSHPYVALLASLHGSRLLAVGLHARNHSPAERALLEQALARRAEREAALRARCAGLPTCAAWVTEEALATAVALLRLTDDLSLLACMGERWPWGEELAGLPDRDGATPTFRVRRPAPETLVIEPYPFGSSPIALPVSGRWIPAEPLPSASALQTALATAPWRQFVATLQPA